MICCKERRGASTVWLKMTIIGYSMRFEDFSKNVNQILTYAYWRKSGEVAASSDFFTAELSLYQHMKLSRNYQQQD